MGNEAEELDVLSTKDCSIGDIDKDETNPLVDRVLELQSLRYFKHEIRIKLEEELSTPDKPIKVEWVLLGKLLAAANRRREKLLKRPASEVRCDALTFYETMIRSEETKPMDKIRSQERLDLLLGLERYGMEGETPEDKAQKARAALKEALGQMSDGSDTDRQMDSAQVSSATASPLE